MVLWPPRSLDVQLCAGVGLPRRRVGFAGVKRKKFPRGVELEYLVEVCVASCRSGAVRQWELSLLACFLLSIDRCQLLTAEGSV